MASDVLLILAFLLGPTVGSATPTDLVSLIDPADYFASRRMEVGSAQMLDQVSAKRADARSSLLRLLAIRWLGENKDRLGEDREAVRQVLEQIAKGTDEFARDHAQIALARIDGKPIPVLRTAPKDSLRDGLAWFPEDVNLAAVCDSRAPAGQRPAAESRADRQLQRILAGLLKTMPEEAREEVFRFAEAVGNVRLDRFAAGFAPSPGGSAWGHLYLRGTGRFDHKRLAAYLREKLGRDVAFAEKKGPRGEPITIVALPDQAPAVALVDDSEIILTGYLSESVNSRKLVDELLAVRAGGRPSLLAGPLGKTLRGVPADARCLVRGDLPREWVAAIARSPLGVSPHQLAVDVLPPAGGGAGLDLRLRGTLDDETDARQFAEGLRKEIKEGVEVLKSQPLPLQLLGVATVRKSVEEIAVDTKGPVVTARAPVSAAALQALLGLLESQLSSGPGSKSDGG
jgi:hypothetical protein